MEKRALMAFKEAVDQVIEEHYRLGPPLHIWEDGKVVAVSARKLRRRSKLTRS